MLNGKQNADALDRVAERSRYQGCFDNYLSAMYSDKFGIHQTVSSPNK
jgi:hypothetical protein